MRLQSFVFAALFSAMVGPAHAEARTDRLALVIGNADYNDNGALETSEIETAIAIEDGFAADLGNAVNDATLLRDSLTSLGYSVDYYSNLDRAELAAAFEAFTRKAIAAPATAKVVVYYAGHALDVGGTMYLLPVNATRPRGTPNSDAPLEPETMGESCLATTDLLQSFRPSAGPGFNLFIFDGCRTDPWPNRAETIYGMIGSLFVSLGESDVMWRDNRLPERTSVAYAAAFGRTAADGDLTNSPFALALHARMSTRQLSVAQVLSRVRSDTYGATHRSQISTTGGHPLSDTCIAECAPGYPIVPTPPPSRQ